MGINAGLNDGIALARGEYIVFCASDDMLYPTHCETVSRILDEKKDVGAVACLLTAIDENGSSSDYLQHWQKPKIRNRFEYLRKMFLEGNFMLSPGMTMRSSLIKELLPLSMTEVMIQDCALWTKIFFKADVVWTEEPLVYYRRMSDGANISVDDETTILRCEWEMPQLLDLYLDMSIDLVQCVFNSEIQKLGLRVDNIIIPYVLGRVALLSSRLSHKAWGYRTIVNFAKKPEVFSNLHEIIGFDYKTLLALVEKPLEKKPPRKKGLEKLFYKLFRHFEKRNKKKRGGI
jgi:glycosyltransferase involved in cell wall biosynthesis